MLLAPGVVAASRIAKFAKRWVLDPGSWVLGPGPWVLGPGPWILAIDTETLHGHVAWQEIITTVYWRIVQRCAQ